MDVIKKSKLIAEEKNSKNSTKVVIITSIDDDQVNNPILSCLNPANFQTIMWDMNPAESLRTNNNELEINRTKTTNVKKRKADLTCVVCGAEAICYNFAQITCESCKAFFRRNALQPLEKTKCFLAKDNRCEIRCDVQHQVKRKCQRCRLLKCFQAGMRKDYILTPEQKQMKRQRLEENRLLRSNIPEEEPTETVTKSPINSVRQIERLSEPSMSLSPSDWLCLTKMQTAYSTAAQSIPSAASVVSIELAPDIMSAFMNTLDIQNFAALKLITFLKEISEFEQLDEHDRLILVKYNLTPLMVIRELFTFDSTREICYDLDSMDNISPTDEAFAHHCKSLFILCYGYEFNRTIVSVLNALEKLVNKNPITIQLLMLIVIFSKGLSADENQEPILNDEKSVFKAQSKYLELLLRYLMENSSYESVVMKMMRIIEQLFKIQKFLRDFQQQIKTKIDVASINPLMKSLLHFT